MPEETRSVGASWPRPAEVIGITVMPCSSIMNGYSFVPCTEPRYFTMRRRRVERWSVTRWSDRMTQSETYSSKPCRVRVRSPRPPVMIALTPLFSTIQTGGVFGAQDRRISEASEKGLDRINDDTLRPDAIDGVAQADEQAFEIVLASFFYLCAFELDVIKGKLLSAISFWMS